MKYKFFQHSLQFTIVFIFKKQKYDCANTNLKADLLWCHFALKAVVKFVKGKI